jgi:pyruvate/2-oxoacid:ferredoxin oxidoreductase alpha subunit
VALGFDLAFKYRICVCILSDGAIGQMMEKVILPEQKAKRPLIADLSNDEILNQVEQALMTREPYYNQAHLQFDSTWLESAGQIKATAQSLAEILQTIL